MPGKAGSSAVAGATKRLKKAQAHFIKVHKKAAQQAVKKARADSSRPAGGTKRRRRRRKAGTIVDWAEQVMPGGRKAGWRDRPVSAQQKARTAWENAKNRARNRLAQEKKGAKSKAQSWIGQL